MTLLSLDGVEKRFGALRVVNQVSFKIDAGEAVGILGPNGAGKTTLLKLIAGTVALSGGNVEFDGHSIDSLPPETRCHLGISRTSQIPQPFGGMTVWENVLTASLHGGHRSPGVAEEEAYICLKRTGLLGQHHRLGGELSLMSRKRLELSRALACTPRLLLLDEIAGGLSEFEVKDLVALVREINTSGIAIIWIEHIVHALLSTVSRIIALDFGNLIVDGRPSEVINSTTLKQAYFGEKKPL